MIYIIADDLTGATDTGVQFNKKGYSPVVHIAENTAAIKQLDHNSDQDVVVIDSESRDLTDIEAKNRIEKIVQKIKISENDIIYKKIDSTLRGNIGIEIEKIMAKFNRNICIFAPSFPTNSRVVVGGYLLVQNEPLGMSKYYAGKLDKGSASYIPSLLQEGTDYNIAKIGLKEVMSGPEEILKKIHFLYNKKTRIIVFDAVAEQHLENIFKSTERFKGPLLYAGSAGLAAHFPQIISPRSIDNKKLEPIYGGEEHPFLIVIGTRREIMNKQVDYLKKKSAVSELKIDITKLYSNFKKYTDIYLQKARNVLAENKHLILRNIPVSISEMKDISSRKLEMMIRDFLGEISALVIKEYSLNNIIVSGGDTSLGLCKALGINSLKIEAEILPGIPLSRSKTNNHDIRFVTKAGGFGDQETLFKIINKLQNYK